jgi:hypothetical protein
MNLHLKKSLAICAVLGVSAWQVHAQQPSSPNIPLTQVIPSNTLGELKVSGYGDFYYQTDFGRPNKFQQVNGRWYDTAHDQFSVSAVQLDLSLSPTKRHAFGFYVSLLEGPASNILASTEPGHKRSHKDFSQAYLIYDLPTKVPIELDFGKWYAFVGYEGLDSRSQDNYSRSFTFTSLEPDYMMGFRLIATASPRLTLNGYLYQGYNEIKNSNSTTMVGAGATYALSDKLTATLQGYNGKESDDKLNDSGSYGGIGFPTPGASWVTQGNLVLIYQKNSKDKFAFDGTYASAVGKGPWNGQALYYRRQINSRNAACIRVERADDGAGLRFLAGGLLLHSITATYDYAPSANLLLRFELRQDYSNNAFFNAATGLTKQRTTLTFAQIFKF